MTEQTRYSLYVHRLVDSLYHLPIASKALDVGAKYERKDAARGNQGR